MRFLLGAYGPEMNGAATGIGLLEAPDAAELLFHGDAVTVAGSPSWVARHPHLDVVYAALEGAGTVQAFTRTGEVSWAPLGEPVEAGDAVCHAAVSPEGDLLLASCYGDGRFVAYPLAADGSVDAPVIADAASDPLALPGLTTPDAAENERVSRTHQSAFLPGGFIATSDLGFDLVRIWRRDGAAGKLRLVQAIALPKGVGPRHMTWHPSGHLYVVTELSNEVYVIAPSREGNWGIIGATVLSPETGGEDYAAEISLSRDAEVVYAGVRGSNTMAVLRVRGDGSTIAPVALVETGVNWPRHHLVVGDRLLVAGQLSDEVVTRSLDERTGVPGSIRARAQTPAPTQILALD